MVSKGARLRDGEVIEAAREVKVAGQYDVIVVGGGGAGIAAAIAASRTGAKTLLVEQLGYLGGELTAGFQFKFGQPSFYSGKDQVIRGITGELVSQLVKIGGFLRTDGSSPFNHELFKYVALKMVREAGVKVRFYTYFSEPIMNGQSIEGIITESKNGREAFLAKRVIDCSGDADVAARAGVPFQIGRKTDHQVQPLNMGFMVGGVNIDEVIAYVREHPEDFGMGLNRTIMQDGVRPVVRVTGFFEITRRYAEDYGLKVLYTRFQNLPMGDGKEVVYVNMARAYKQDPLDPDAKTEADLMLREQVFSILRFLQDHIPGFGRSYLISTSPWVAVRESRRIEGEYILQAEDVLQGKTFDDAVFRSAIAFAQGGPAHPVDGNEGCPGSTYEYLQNEWVEYEVPYAMSIPKKVDNLLVAGKCKSASHEAMGLTKSVPVCMAEGQAVGTAAALSIKEGVVPRALDVRLLQRQLKTDGVYLPNIKE
jgi:hypothetical protein